jgi:hypothetical protein
MSPSTTPPYSFLRAYMATRGAVLVTVPTAAVYFAVWNYGVAMLNRLLSIAD